MAANVRECGGVGDLLGWTSLRIVPPVVWLTVLSAARELAWGLRGFRERQGRQRKILGCGVERRRRVPVATALLARAW